MGNEEALTFSCEPGDNADFLCDQGKCGWTQQTDGFWYSWTFPTKLKVSGISGVAREGYSPGQRLDILYKKPGDTWWSEIANFVCGTSNQFFEFYFAPIEIVALKIEVHPNETGCEQNTNKTDCEAAGCYWFYWDDTCRPSYPNEIKYASGQMKIEALQCSDYTTQSLCELNNCFWYNGSCHDTAPSCSQINNSTDCLAYNCYWYDEACHDSPKQDWRWLIALFGIAAASGIILYSLRHKKGR